MLASLDPLAMPIANCSVAGHRADDQQYIPAIKRARKSLAPEGLLYVGGTKLGNNADFAYLDKTKNHYLCPLSQRQSSIEQIQEAIHLACQDKGQLRPVYRGKELVAQVVEKAKAFASKALKRRKVSKFPQVRYELFYGPKRKREVVRCRLQEKKAELKQAIERLGWRVYATNCPASQLSAEQVVHVCRREYRIEQNFYQLLNKVTKLMPIFLSKQNRIENMIRLLTLALKFSTAIRYQARRALASKNQYLTGLIPC